MTRDEKKDTKKKNYEKAVLTIHRPLKDVTTQGTSQQPLGCTKNFA